jgi:hypothetical protein
LHHQDHDQLPSFLQRIPLRKVWPGLRIGNIRQLQRDTGEPDFPPRSFVPYTVNGSKQFWSLRGGCAYVIVVEGDPLNLLQPSNLLEKGKGPPDVMDILSDSDDEEDLKVIDPPLYCSQWPEDPPASPEIEDLVLELEALGIANPSPEQIQAKLKAPQVIMPEVVGEVDILKYYPIPGLQLLLLIRGQSELAKFVRAQKFVTRQVKCLPPRYNGDIIFEIPPTADDAKKGDRVRSMERAKDCYYWTRITVTLALSK